MSINFLKYDAKNKYYKIKTNHSFGIQVWGTTQKSTSFNKYFNR